MKDQIESMSDACRELYIAVDMIVQKTELMIASKRGVDFPARGDLVAITESMRDIRATLIAVRLQADHAAMLSPDEEEE